MKKILIVLALGMALCIAASAQDIDVPKYQRSSLHMVLLTTDEPTLDGSEDFTALLDECWQKYPFPDKYNEHRIAFTQGYGGAPKGSLFEIINKYKDGFDGLSLLDAKDIMENVTAGKEYNNNLVAAIDELNVKEKIGNQLIRKWFNIKDDGSWNYDLITERAEYSANQAAVAEANATSRGIQGIVDQGENLIANTYVTFSKLAFYQSEPVAAFIRNLALFIAGFTPAPARNIMVAAAGTAYEAASKGYTAMTTTALYKLDWNDEVKAAFYEMFKANNKIDMKKFNDYTFGMSLVGIDNASSTTIDVIGGLANIVGIDKAKPDDQLIEQTVVRNIDKILAKMQRNYEDFAPVSQIISVDPLLADMGKKEGLVGGEAFNLLEPQMDPETNEIVWKTVGVVRVDKKQIWDNRYSLTDESKNEAESEAEPEVKGTLLTANKNAAVGMVVKQVVKAKPKTKANVKDAAVEADAEADADADAGADADKEKVKANAKESVLLKGLKFKK